MLRYRFSFLLFGFAVVCNVDTSKFKPEHEKGNLRTKQSQACTVSATDKHIPEYRSLKKDKKNQQKFLQQIKIKKPYQSKQARTQFSQNKCSGSVLGFNPNHSAGFQVNSQVSYPELQGKTIRPGKIRRSRKMKDSFPTNSQIGQPPHLHGHRNDKRDQLSQVKLSKKYKNTTINHQKRYGDRAKWGDVKDNLKGNCAGNGDIQMSYSQLNSSEALASTRNAVQKTHLQGTLHGLKQDVRVVNFERTRQNCESSSDSVTAIGSPKIGNTLCKTGVSVNNDRDEQPWNVEESDDVLGEGRRQIAEARCSILKNDQSSSHSFLAEKNPACGENDRDRVLDELNFHVKNIEKCGSGRFADECRDAKDFLLSPARLCTFGLSEGAEVLKGVEKARQEMIREMEAMERNAQEKSDSSVHEPQKEEDPEEWARWQDAKRLLKNIRKQERQLFGSGSSAQFTDKDLLADPAGIGTDENMLGSALDAEIHVPSQDDNLTGIYNMTFKNLAAGLLELVRRRTGLNSSSDAQLHTDNIQDGGSRSTADSSELSQPSHDSGMVVEMNEEEGVTRWVDAVDAVTSQPTPSWKRIGRSKRNSRSAQCAEIDRDDIADSVKNLFAEASNDYESKIPLEGKSQAGQTKNIKAADSASTPSWKRLGKRKKTARSIQSAGIIHDEIIESVQGLFPSPLPSDKQSSATISLGMVSRDGQTELPSFSTPTWKRIGRIKRICRAGKLAGNSQDEMVGFTDSSFLVPPSPHPTAPSISMPISSSLLFSRLSPERVSVVNPSDCSLPIIDDSTPSPLPVSKSACKARPFSRSIQLSALSTISKQSPLASLDDPKMLPTTSNTCTITATDAQAMAQDRDAFIAIKQGIKPFCPDHAEDHDDELVKTPVQVRRVLNRIDDLLARHRVSSASSIPCDSFGQAETACRSEAVPPNSGKQLLKPQSELRITESNRKVLRDSQTRTVVVAKAAAAPRRRTQDGPSSRPVPLLRRGQAPTHVEKQQ